MSINNSKILIITLASFFGLFSGVVGAIIARVYVLEDAFNLPLIGDISLDSNNNNNGLIIRDAKKIVIEQNDKVSETANNVKSNLVGIFKKIEPKTGVKKTATPKNDIQFNPEDYYKLDNEVGQGFIITSDGWIVSSFIPEKFSNDLATSSKEAILKNYVIILNDHKIYPAKNIISDPLNKYAFWRISASDLPVKRFVNADEVKNGQLVLAVNWDNDVALTTIVSKEKEVSSFPASSDNFSIVIKTANQISDDFKGGFIFNLNSEIVALIDKDGKSELISSLVPCMNCLFKMNEIIYPKLGLNYIELSGLIDSKTGVYSKGALIYSNKNTPAISKGGAADLAGLKAGDIITKVNNVEINSENDLSSQINKYLTGDELLIEYIRDNKTANVKAVLQ